MTVSVVDEALRALDRVRQQLAQERAVKNELLAALKSIAANSCCTPCREAGLFAKAALRNIEFMTASAEGRRPHDAISD